MGISEPPTPTVEWIGSTRLRSAYWNGILSAEEDDNVDQARQWAKLRLFAVFVEDIRDYNKPLLKIPMNQSGFHGMSFLAFGRLLTCWWVRGGVIYTRDIRRVMLLFEFQWKYTICQWWYGKWRCSAWNRKSHLASLLFCCVCYGIYCDIIAYVYRVWYRYVILCIYIYIFCMHAYTSDIILYIYTHIFVLLLCLRFRRWFFLLVFAIAVCRTVWLGGAATAVWKAVCRKGLWALWANERVQVDSGAMYRQRQGVCWGSFFFFEWLATWMNKNACILGFFSPFLCM